MTHDLAAIAYRLRKATVIRYGLASVGALAVDMGTFLALLALGGPPAVSSATGYTLGIVVHWILSSRKVFTDAVAERGAARNRQKALFVVSALIGLGLTTAIVGLATAVDIDPRAAKLAAIVASFAATWIMRKHLVFRSA